MKVNLTYSVDFEELPKEIKRMMEEVAPKAELLYGFLSMGKVYESVKEKNVISAIKTIENLRQNMIDIDLRLDDVTNILIGYQETLTAIEKEKHKQKNNINEEIS